MTRDEAIETVKQVMIEQRLPRYYDNRVCFESTIVAILIALEVLKVEE
jgi:hypothetical protein